MTDLRETYLYSAYLTALEDYHQGLLDSEEVDRAYIEWKNHADRIKRAQEKPTNPCT